MGHKHALSQASGDEPAKRRITRAATRAGGAKLGSFQDDPERLVRSGVIIDEPNNPSADNSMLSTPVKQIEVLPETNSNNITDEAARSSHLRSPATKGEENVQSTTQTEGVKKALQHDCSTTQDSITTLQIDVDNAKPNAMINGPEPSHHQRVLHLHSEQSSAGLMKAVDHDISCFLPEETVKQSSHDVITNSVSKSEVKNTLTTQTSPRSTSHQLLSTCNKLETPSHDSSPKLTLQTSPAESTPRPYHDKWWQSQTGFSTWHLKQESCHGQVLSPKYSPKTVVRPISRDVFQPASSIQLLKSPNGLGIHADSTEAQQQSDDQVLLSLTASAQYKHDRNSLLDKQYEDTAEPVPSPIYSPAVSERSSNDASDHRTHEAPEATPWAPVSPIYGLATPKRRLSSHPINDATSSAPWSPLYQSTNSERNSSDPSNLLTQEAPSAAPWTPSSPVYGLVTPERSSSVASNLLTQEAPSPKLWSQLPPQDSPIAASSMASKSIPPQADSTYLGQPSQQIAPAQFVHFGRYTDNFISLSDSRAPRSDSSSMHSTNAAAKAEQDIDYDGPAELDGEDDYDDDAWKDFP